MKLSFVIPAYNEEARIAKCLEALLGEIKKGNFDAEVLVVNNASTDNTATVAKTFPEVTVIDEPRKGLSQARQTGFEHSSGDLIANIDADTVMQPGWIDTVLKTFTDKPDILALSGPHYFYDIPKTQRFITQVFYRLAYASYLLNKHVLQTSSLLQGGNFVITRKALEAVGGFNPAFTFYGEDTDIAKRLHKIGNVVFTFKLPLHASGRRLVQEGYLRMAWLYVVNNLSTIFLGKAITQHRRDLH